MAADKLNILGTEFEFVGDDKNRINLFEKNDKLLIGGIDIFNELHIFLADTGSEEELATSLKTAYPDYINTGVIDLGAKVLLGEIQWG